MNTVRVEISAEPFVFAVFSDTHGRNALLPACVRRIGASAVIHLGDNARDAAGVGLPKYAVRGNCDISSDYPSELLLEIGARRVLLTHGHHYGVKYDPTRLIERAKELGACVALYGHTHIADVYNDGGVIAANPGSLSQPRSYVQGPCYGKLVYVDGKLVYVDGKLGFDVVRVK